MRLMNKVAVKKKSIDDGVTCMIYLKYQDRVLKW
jgi:hypothetical protein